MKPALGPVLGIDLVRGGPSGTGGWRATAGRAAGDGERLRFSVVMGVFALAFVVLAMRLPGVAVPEADATAFAYGQSDNTVRRPPITDRNGRLIAADVPAASLHADPRRIHDKDEAVNLLKAALPDLDADSISRRLHTDRGFVWIRRNLTPKQQSAVHEQGLPGIGFRHGPHRVYPNGRTAAHLLGYVDTDNNGIAGMEEFLDRRPVSDEPLSLSVDLAVQHALRTVLSDAMDEFSARAATGIVLKADSGEVIAMTSLPDFDPNAPSPSDDAGQFNSATKGVYEMGSTFKLFTTAMALDSGTVTLDDTFDARGPLKAAGHTIRDYRPQNSFLSVPDILIRSSNIASARMAQKVGHKTQHAFLSRFGLLDRLDIETPETGTPITPSRWREINTISIAYGYGISVSPLQLAAAGAALVNGGWLIQPTLLRRDAPADRLRVISADTGDTMRRLMRRVVAEGTGKKADVPGYGVIGKTGTAEKNVLGKYDETTMRTSFLGAFPANDPQYITLVLLDEPQGTAATHGYATAGWTAAPVTSRLVARIAPLLRLTPEFAPSDSENGGTKTASVTTTTNTAANTVSGTVSGTTTDTGRETPGFTRISFNRKNESSWTLPR